MREPEQDYLRILLDFGDKIRSLVSPNEVVAVALATIGQYCGAARSIYSEITDPRDYLTVRSSWTDGRLGPIHGQQMSQFGAVLGSVLAAGQIIWSDDVTCDPRLVQESATRFAELGIRAVLSVPLVRNGQLVAAMCLHDVVPRAWTSDEVTFTREIVTQTWNAVERTRLDLELRKSQAWLSTLSDSMPQLIWTARAGGLVDWTSRQWTSYTGLDQASSQDFGWLDAIHSDDHANVRDAWRLASGEGRLEPLDVDIRVRRHDGAWLWFQTIAVPLPVSGDVTGPRQWLGTCTDVDNLKRTEECLRKSEARFRTVADAMPQIVWTATPEGQRDYFNQRWFEYTGLSWEASMAGGWTGTMHPADVAPTMSHWQDSLRTGSDYEIQHRHRGADGSYRWFMGRGRALRDAPTAEHPDGRIDRWVGTCTDIQELVEAREVLTRGRDELEALVSMRTGVLTQAVDALHTEARERTQAEEHLRQSQKMEAIGQLTGGIAHDFNNMLQGIGANLDVMQAHLEQGRVADLAPYLQAARHSVDRAGTLTHRLLAFARRQVLDARPVQIDHLIEGMCDLFRRTVGPAIRLELDFGDGKWPVLCDVNQFENMLLNLIINARDAMPDGGTLTIATRDVRLDAADVAGQDDAVPGEYVEIAVTDTGTGITPELLEHVFEPFFTTKPTGQGTGLGLSQVYGFVRQSHSTVRIESTPGQGTTVRIHMPGQPSEPVVATSPIVTRAAEPDGTGETVLLVEDEDGVRQLIAERLRELHYEVLEAVDSPSALRLLASAGPLALLLTDVGLPDGLNGRQIAEIARQRRPDLPVLFITGYAAGKLDDQLAPGMEVIVKPFRLNVLMSRVHDMIAGSYAEATAAGA